MKINIILGQKVPKGLHVRINLETGITEAKLLSKNKKANTAVKAIQNEKSDDITDDTGQQPRLSPIQLKETLKRLKNDDSKATEAEGVKKQFKSYDEIKKDLEKLNIDVVTEAEALTELLEKHNDLMSRKEIDEEEILTILEDLEYWVHRYDNANVFVQINGFRDVIYKNLNSTNREIRRETLKLLGSSMQNNIKVKIHALETGSINVLLRILALDVDLSVKYRALFALGGLLRDFPYAQLKFVENGGLSVFSKLFKMRNLKIHMKMITLIGDLLQEELNSRKDPSSKDYTMKMVQYDEVNLRNRLLRHGYCENLDELVIDAVKIGTSDHDIVEKCLTALYSVIDECADHLSQKSKDILVNLRDIYKKLSENQNDENVLTEDLNFFTVLYELSDRIVDKLKETAVRDEL